MLGKFGILVVLLILVLLFYVVISFGAGAFSKEETKPETKQATRQETSTSQETSQSILGVFFAKVMTKELFLLERASEGGRASFLCPRDVPFDACNKRVQGQK